MEDELEAAKRDIAAPEVKPERPKATTEWGQLIADSVSRYNEEVAKFSDDPKHRITVYQVINHIARISVGSQEDLKTNGKQDKAKVAGILAGIWTENSQDILDMTDAYLSEKLRELTPQENVAAGSLPGDMEGGSDE